jgi:tRNA threonylcarbamoyladenosine dehydratase
MANLVVRTSRLPINEDDVSMIFEDVYQGRSLIPPHDVPTKPSLVRWDPLKPITIDNCVPMDWREAEKHTRECSENGRRPEDVWGTDTVDIYERRAKEILRDRQWAMQL